MCCNRECSKLGNNKNNSKKKKENRKFSMANNKKKEETCRYVLEKGEKWNKNINHSDTYKKDKKDFEF